MIEKVLSNIGGIGVYGVISICIFFAFFTGMLVWSFSLQRSRLDEWSNLPLEGTEPDGIKENESQPN